MNCKVGWRAFHVTGRNLTGVLVGGIWADTPDLEDWLNAAPTKNT